MSEPVYVYTSTGCPHCHKVKDQLKAWGVAYEERNVSENQEYFEILQKNRIFGTPATFIGNKIVLGFNPDKMDKLIEEFNIPKDAAGGAAGNIGTGIEASRGAVMGAAGADESAPTQGAQGQDVKASTDSDDIFQPATNDILNQVWDLVTVGGGPAGASAAVYASRGKLKTLVIDKAPAAGTLALTHKIANYPGVREEVTGLELLTRMQRQAKDFGTSFVRTHVLSVDFSDPDIKKLVVPEGTIQAKSVFIAVGSKAPSNKIKGEEDLTGRGVSYCSTCDAAFFENKTVVVYGDNEEAVHEAEALSKFTKEVKFLIPLGELKGDTDLTHLETKPNITILKKYRVKEIIGEHSVEKIVIQDDQKQEHTWEVDGIFIYLGGLKPGTDFIRDAVKRDDEGYIIVDGEMRTSVDGVFAGGDARRTPIKQAVISASDGCIAALGADQHVNKRAKMKPQYS